MKAKDSTLETPQDNLISIPKFSVKEVSKVVFGGFAVDRFLFSKPDKLPLRSQTLPQAMIACANKGKGWHLFTAFQWSAMAYLWKKATSLDDCICDLHPEVWQWIMGLFMDGNGHVDILASLEVSYAGSPYGRGTIRGAEGSTPKIVCDGKGNNWLKNWRPGAFDGMKVYIAEAGNGDGEFFPITVTSETTITLPRGANPGKGPATFCIVRHVASDVTHGMISGNKITTLRESDADLKAFAIPAASNNQGSVDLGYDRFWFYKTSSLRAAVRGGSFYYEAGAGVFALHLGNAPSYSYCNIGFRAGKAL